MAVPAQFLVWAECQNGSYGELVPDPTARSVSIPLYCQEYATPNWCPSPYSIFFTGIWLTLILGKAGRYYVLYNLCNTTKWRCCCYHGAYLPILLLSLVVTLRGEAGRGWESGHQGSQPTPA